MAMKPSLFNRIREHILKNADTRLNQWRERPGFNEEQMNKEFDLLYDELKDARPMMAIDADALEKVLKSGKFKNQFQVDGSGGVFSRQSRAEHSNEHFGTPIKYAGTDEFGRKIIDVADKNLKNSEKYGYVKAVSPNAVRGYGRYTVNFNPNVKDRMTVHIGDSLGSDSFSFIPGDKSTYPAMFDDPQFRGEDNANEYMKGIHEWDRKGQYIEAQYHGPLCSGDIHSIKADRNSVPESVRKFSRDYYIPLYDDDGCYSACRDVAGNLIEL